MDCNPPNLRMGVCCGTCKNGSWFYESSTWCSKYKLNYKESALCDDWEEDV
jgi:hypothetical protein